MANMLTLATEIHGNAALPGKVEASTYGARMYQALHLYCAAFNQALPAGPTLPQYIVLSALGAHAPCSQRRLVELTGIDRSTMAELVFRLEKRGLLKRARSEADRRAYEVALTDEGRATYEAAKVIIRKVERSLSPRIAAFLARAEDRL